MLEVLKEDPVNDLMCNCMEERLDCLDEGGCTVRTNFLSELPLDDLDDEEAMAEMMAEMAEKITCYDLCPSSLCARAPASQTTLSFGLAATLATLGALRLL